MLNENNKVKDLKLKELENNLIDLNKMLHQTKIDLENTITEVNNGVII